MRALDTLKALGNHGGPHLLAAEWIGTHLARWFGLPTFDFGLITVTADDEIQFLNGQRALPGPAFITARASRVWCGAAPAGALEKLVNPEDVGKLVLFDTSTRNCGSPSTRPRRTKAEPQQRVSVQ